MIDEPQDLEVRPEQPVTVRETRRLFRLTPVPQGDPAHCRIQVAIVPADTEEEARAIATLHDAAGNDWRDPAFVFCDVIETREAHVVGDATFYSSPALVPNRPRG